MVRKHIEQRRPHCGNSIPESFKIVECCDTCEHGPSDPMGCYLCLEDGTKCPDRDTYTDAWHQWLDDHYTRACGWCDKYTPPKGTP